MGLLDSISGGLGAAQGGSTSQGALLEALSGLLSHGGLNNLVWQFEQNGLAHVVASWISTGSNLPISAAELQGALGENVMGRLSQQTGLPADQLAPVLTRLLPQVVDQLTPHGHPPAAGLGDLSSVLGNLLAR